MVRAEAIFGPVGVLALWTMLVLLSIGFRRVRAVRARRVTPDDFRLGESADVPESVALANRNLMNLLEIPVLFYVVCLCLYVTHQVHRGQLELAWAYVALRVLHSFVHLTTNHVRRRLFIFVLSNIVLVAIWVGFLKRVA